MSNELRDPLEDLLGGVPAHVVPDARAAWKAGSRRRLRRRVGTAAVLLAVVALVSAGAGVLPRAALPQPADRPGGGVGGYPERIDNAWWIRDLPDDPGPIAGLLETYTRPGWDAVSADGHRWHLPDWSRPSDSEPSLSDDGTLLGYLSDQGDGTGAYVLQDLLTGERTTFGDVGDAHDTSTDRYLVYAQTPGYVAPDNTAVVVNGDLVDSSDRGVDGLLLGVDGTVRELSVPTHPYLAGWLPDGSIVWVSWKSRGTDTGTDVYVTSREGELVRHLELQSVGRLDFSQHSPRVSPDGTRLALVTGGFSDSIRLRVFSMADGSQLAVSDPAPDASDSCPAAWAGEVALLPAAGALLEDTQGQPVVAADPRLEVACSLWAPDALAGDRHRGVGGLLFGTGGGWMGWHYREVALGSLAGAMALVGLVLVGRRRVRRAAPEPIDWYSG